VNIVVKIMYLVISNVSFNYFLLISVSQSCIHYNPFGWFARIVEFMILGNGSYGLYTYDASYVINFIVSFFKRI